MADFERMAAFLAETLGGRGDVERIDTHTAAVFLAGDRAWKLRRPVDYGFLDYSTRRKRHAAAEREVEDNARGAPGLYLGIAGIVGEGEALSLVAPPAPEDAEPVVEMHRFDGSCLFDRMAAEHRIDRALMHETGKAVAEMHKAAPTRPCRRPLPDLALAEVSAIDRLAPIIGEGTAGEVAALLRRRGRALAGTAGDRPARRCHGDLHLRNIVLWRGRPAPFDCIDFNDELTDIDPLYDLAFLLMDLAHRGEDALATACLNAWAERMAAEPGAEPGTAYGGLGLLPLYKACRAAIRAKVAGLTAETLGAESEEGRAEAAEARAYLDLARGWLEAEPAPRLVAVGGLSGSGKSTLARALAERFGAVVLRSDAIRKGLAGVEETETLPPGSYTPEASERVYAEMAARARMALDGGMVAILDAAHLKPGERDAAEALAAELGVPFTGLWLDAPQDVLTERVEARARDASDATASVVAKQTGYDLGPIRWARLAAGRGVEAVVSEAERIISEAGGAA